MKRGRPLRQDTLRGDRIRELRKSMGMTQEALADLIGVSRTALTNFEGGHSECTLANLSLLAYSLNTTSDYLLDLTDVKEKTQ